jgi:hypothetical protein
MGWTEQQKRWAAMRRGERSFYWPHLNPNYTSPPPFKGRIEMSIYEIEKLAEHAVKHGDYSVENCWLKEVRPQTILAMIGLIREMGDALEMVNRMCVNNYEDYFDTKQHKQCCEALSKRNQI